MRANIQEEKMELTNLTFIVTDACNFNCTYCPQKKEKKTITRETIRAAVDFFFPFLSYKHKVYIGFYGGEPLLAFDQVKYAVRLLLGKNRQENKDIAFTLTTNGSLINEPILKFFNKHRFAIQLSFDGLAQEKSRQRGSLAHTLQVMKQIQSYSNIAFEINSVFTPQTVGDLCASMRFIIEQGGPDISFSLSAGETWGLVTLETLKKEMARLVDYLVLYYKRTGQIPVKNFRPMVSPPGISRCGAGKDHMAVTPEGKVWGCFLFHDYFKSREKDPEYQEYAFGQLSDFIRDFKISYSRLKANYSELRQDFYQVEGNGCFLCPDLEMCRVCPINAAYDTGSLGEISCQKCQLIKIEKTFKDILFSCI